jgi:hypothetical protein
MRTKTGEADLLAKLNAAVKAANEAGAEHLSRSKTVGLLLLEAKKLHPAVKDFEAFLKRVQGLHLSRAYDLMRFAGGRTTDEELREAARERQRKSRAKPLPKPTTPEPEPTPDPEPISVTSRKALAEFTVACRTWLPKMTEADRQKARLLVAELTGALAEAA